MKVKEPFASTAHLAQVVGLGELSFCIRDKAIFDKRNGSPHLTHFSVISFPSLGTGSD